MLKFCIDLKKWLYKFRGGKTYEVLLCRGATPVLRVPWMVGGWVSALGQLHCLFTISSLVVWVQHSRMTANTFFFMSWKGKKLLAEAQFLLHSTPKWGKVVQLLFSSERVLLRKLSRKDDLHTSAKPAQGLSPLPPSPVWTNPHSPAVLSPWAAPTHGEPEPFPRDVLPGASSHIFHLQHRWSSASALALPIGAVWSPDPSPSPQPYESWQLGGSKGEEVWADLGNTPLLWLESAWGSLTLMRIRPFVFKMRIKLLHD